MQREYRLQAALRSANEALPLAAMVDACHDPAVIGAPFYLMHRLSGHAHTPDTLGALPAETVHNVGLSLAEALAGLHQVDPAGVAEMAEFVRTEPYADRQLRRWSGQWRRAQAATGLADEPALDDVFGALSASRPPVPSPRVVHGDYGFANVLFDAGAPTRVQAVLDWELSTVGDPLADLGALSAYWSEAGRLLNEGRADPVCHPSLQPALPTVSSLADRYAAASGSDAGLEHLGWYIALAAARLAVIVAGALARIDPDNPAEADRRAHTRSLVHNLAVAAHDVLPARTRR
jgi:aminoglycoside phosphotransferase (APT) family kinase protein